MLAHDYSTALCDLLKKGDDPEVLFTSLKSLLKKKGQEKLYSKILNTLLVQYTKNTADDVLMVTVGREKDIKNLEGSILKAMSTLGDVTEYSTHVDPTLIGGFKIKGSDTVIDQSYKKQLLTIYRSLTT